MNSLPIDADKDKGNNYMKRKIIITLMIILVAGGMIAAGLYFINNNNNLIEETGPIRAEKVKHIGKHIYYPEDMYALKTADKDTKREFFDYIEKLDKNIDYDIYVCGMHRFVRSRDICINAYQYLDGVVIPNVFYHSAENSDIPKMLLSDRGTPVSDLDTSNLIPAQDLVDDVYFLAEQNSGKMYFEDYHNQEIYGTYNLEYDTESGILYYSFNLNEYSEVHVDAKTGNIIYKYFWDGTMED